MPYCLFPARVIHATMQQRYSLIMFRIGIIGIRLATISPACLSAWLFSPLFSILSDHYHFDTNFGTRMRLLAGNMCEWKIFSGIKVQDRKILWPGANDSSLRIQSSIRLIVSLNYSSVYEIILFLPWISVTWSHHSRGSLR